MKKRWTLLTIPLLAFSTLAPVNQASMAAENSTFTNEEPNETYSTATPIELNTTYQSTFESEKETTGPFFGSNQYDYYKIELKESGLLTLNVDPKGNNNQSVQVLLTNGKKDNKFLRYTSEPENLGDETASIGLPAGTYYLILAPGTTDENFKYTFKASFSPNAYYEKEENQLLSTANSIDLNKRYTGFFGDNDSVDFYTFTLNSDSFVSFKHKKSPQSYGALKLVDTKNNVIFDEFLFSNNNPPNEDIVRQVGLKKGTYYLEVTGHYEGAIASFPYELEVKTEKDPYFEKELNNLKETSQPIEVNKLYTATALRNEDWFSFDVKKASSYNFAIDINLDNEDINVEFFDPQGHMMKFGSPFPKTFSFVKPSSLDLGYLTPGTYKVSFSGVNQYTKYHFKVSESSLRIPNVSLPASHKQAIARLFIKGDRVELLKKSSDGNMYVDRYLKKGEFLRVYNVEGSYLNVGGQYYVKFDDAKTAIVIGRVLVKKDTPLYSKDGKVQRTVKPGETIRVYSYDNSKFDVGGGFYIKKDANVEYFVGYLDIKQNTTIVKANGSKATAKKGQRFVVYEVKDNKFYIGGGSYISDSKTNVTYVKN